MVVNEGIELSSSDWKSDIIAIILIHDIWSPHTVTLRTLQFTKLVHHFNALGADIKWCPA